MPGMCREASIDSFLPPTSPPEWVLTICWDPGFCLWIFTYSGFLVLTPCFLETFIFKYSHVPYFSNHGIYFLVPSACCSSQAPTASHAVWSWYGDALVGNGCLQNTACLAARSFPRYPARSSVGRGKLIHKRATEKSTRLRGQEPTRS